MGPGFESLRVHQKGYMVFLFCANIAFARTVRLENSDTGLTDHCLLRKLTVNELACGKFVVNVPFYCGLFRIPTQNARYRHKGGMHDVVQITDGRLCKFRGAKKLVWLIVQTAFRRNIAWRGVLSFTRYAAERF